MNTLVLAATTLLLAGQTLAFKEFNRRFMANPASYYLFNVAYLLPVVLILALTGGSLESPALLTIVLGSLFGAVFVGATLSYMKAMETGPMSFASLFFSLGLLLPVLAGVLFWGESATALQLIGLLLLVVTLYLISGSSVSRTGSVDLRWALFTGAAFIGNGAVLTIMKEHQILLHGRQIREFLMIAFLVAAGLSGILLFVQKGRGESTRHMGRSVFLFIAAAAAVTTAFGNVLNLYLSTRISGVIQFPVVNGGVVLISSALSFILYRERIAVRGISGLVLGVAALVLVSLR
ncbi:EamA family transporter [Salinispira pacifica]